VQWDFKKLRRRGRQTEVLSQDAPSWQLHLGAEPRVGTWGDEVLEAKWGRLETMYPTLAGFSLSKSFLYPSLHTHTHTHTNTRAHTCAHRLPRKAKHFNKQVKHPLRFRNVFEN
jgi:hypothetical protein